MILKKNGLPRRRKTLCGIFSHSPIFRIGGDEFAIVVQNDDYDIIDELVEKVDTYNSEAIKSGGVVIACGMAKFVADPCVAPVFERADQNMYINKNYLKS